MKVWAGSSGLVLGLGSPAQGLKTSRFREGPALRTNDLQDQCGLVLHVLNAQRHLVGARVGTASGPYEQDGVCRAVADAHFLTCQRLPLSGPGHLRSGLALWGRTAHF